MQRRHATLGPVASILFVSVLAQAQFVPTNLDVGGLRVPQAGEGFLVHKPNPLVTRSGDEYTGWIDIRHPARASVNANNTFFGYDMSDHFINIRTTTLTDSAGTVAMPQIERDLTYSNRAWLAQAGLSFIENAHRNYTSGGANPGGQPVNFTFPPDLGGAAGSDVFDGRIGSATNNLTGGPASRRIDMYYVGPMDNVNNSVFRGYMYFSGVNTLASQGLNNPGDFRPFGVVATTGDDTAVADTFAHEIGHFLLNGPSVDNPGTGGHSNTRTNLMASGSIRWYPGQAAGDISMGPPLNPPSQILFNPGVVGKTMILNADGTPRVGGVDQLTGGTSAQSQVRRVFDAAGNATSTNYLNLNRNAGAGDRLDFDFVADVGRMDGNVASTDPNNVDGVPGADNAPGATGERLFFGKGTAVASDQTGKDKTGLGTFAGGGDFNGPSFKFADIFSLGTRYGDSDIDANGNLSLRENALDYKVQFRDDAGNVSDGIAQIVYTSGWTTMTAVDNFVARWTPMDPNFMATGLFVIALDGTFNGARYDAHAQIDAVIVGVPEPAGIAAAALSLVMLPRRRTRRW